jgi:hypothetical protein
MKRIVLVFVCLLAILLSACTSSPSPYEQGLINYNGEWVTLEEYERLKDSPQPSTTPLTETPPPPVPALEPTLTPASSGADALYWAEADRLAKEREEAWRLKQLEWRVNDLEKQLGIYSSPFFNTKDDLERRIHDMERELGQASLAPSPFNTMDDLERRASDLEREIGGW